MQKMTLENRKLFAKLKEARFEPNGSLESLILERHGKSRENVSEKQFVALRNFLESFKKASEYRWRNAERSQQKFDRRYSAWPSEHISIPELMNDGAGSSKSGRPAKDFSDLSKRSRHRSTAPLREENSGEKLLHAAAIKLCDEGQGDFASVIAECQESPTSPSKYRRLSGVADALDSIPKNNVTLPTKISFS